MRMNIYGRTARWVGLLLCLALTRPLQAQVPCQAPSGSASAAGWASLRQDSLDAAERHFRRALFLCSSNLDAITGNGYLALRRGQPGRADTLFTRVVTADSANGDAWIGLALGRERLGDSAGAVAAARRALLLAPRDPGASAVLDRLTPGWRRPALVDARRPDSLQLASRVRGTHFEVLRNGHWLPTWLKGVNMGVALPGKFPSEFPTDSALYGDWFRLIAATHANTIRLYTILPPEFYRALRGWNVEHPDSALWLVHGVWTELPDEGAFDAPAFENQFRAEMHRVVDVIHGHADLPPRPGHASGRYDADVSRWTMAFIIGREWEPYAVKAFDQQHPGTAPYHGRFLSSAGAPAMDRWLAEQCDTMLAYEFDRWHALRPIAYTNWPTLDPLTHPTESNGDEERAWRRRAGRQAEGNRLEYDNDVIGLDAELIRPTRANPAGWFASFHAYPYYPDFMLYDPGYNTARSPEGRSNYFGYLTDLVRHHQSMPVLIAEYGVPSSRGDAHVQPQGWDHGGHDEQAMARIDARLTRELHGAGTAGGLVFAWIDEWFKRNWVVTDFELPVENNRRWHNVMDAEQNYGLIGMYAGDSATRPVPGGNAARWRRLPVVASGDGMLRALHVGSDGAFVYLAVEVTSLGSRVSRPATRDPRLQIAISTYRDSVGQHRLPRTGVTSPLGFEFLVDLPSPDSGSIRVLPEYNRYAPIADPKTGDDLGRFYHRPITILNRSDGRFDPMFVITNRARFGRDGTFFPAQGVDRGRLRFGRASASSLADWYLDPEAGLVEIRIPWDLLNVSDPSSRTILYERNATGDFGTVTAGDFRFLVVAQDKATGAVEQLGPSRGWRWEGWTDPAWFARTKPAYDSLTATWGAIR
ncbi:MAG TPA: hypothetical protein VFL88_00120 [Gemmatimonadales bacterium]|nr:hypothetical protein [Gemmatimonadales bacterium]